MRSLTATIALALSLAAAGPAPLQAQVTQVSSQAGMGFGDALGALRAGYGLGGLQADPRLMAAAQGHAADMAAGGYFSHRGRDGSSAHARAQAAGCRGGYSAENIAWGQSSAGDAFAGWVASPPHLANMVGRAYGVFGLGQADGYWVLMFADRC